MSDAREFRARRVHRAAEVRRIVLQGRRYRSQHVVAVVDWRQEGGPRLGVIAGKRLGKATVRNRVKRRLREIARRLWPRLSGPADILLLARPSAGPAPFCELSSSVERLLCRAGLLGPQREGESAPSEGAAS